MSGQPPQNSQIASQNPKKSAKTVFFLGLLLFLSVFLLFSPSLRYELVAIDDIHYISYNQLVLSGLSWASVRAAFTGFYHQMYAPLLWVSYMVDVTLFKATPDNPWGFHFTNVLLHSLNSLLLYFLLLAWCKKPWHAFVFTALWALHPLRVESVAWVTERKDVLSGFFGLLSIGCYLKAQQPSGGRRLGCLLLSLVLFACGLLAKASLTPIPLILLLLDYWPLRRYDLNVPSLLRSAPRLLLDKVPFILLSFASAIAAVKAHQATYSIGNIPLAKGLLEVPIHYGFYLFKIFRPRNLFPLYPPVNFSWSDFCLACGLLFVPTVWFWGLRRRHPNAGVGWLWFLIMLLPVSGLVRFGAQVVADRFSYLPAIGLSIAGLFLVHRSIRFLPRKGTILVWTLLAVGLLLGLTARTLQYMRVWENSERLIAHISTLVPSHPLVLNDRAVQAVKRYGNFKTAQSDLETALLISPKDHKTLVRLAICIHEQQNPTSAIEFLKQRQNAFVVAGEWEFQMAQFVFLSARYPETLEYVELARNGLLADDTAQNNLVFLGMAAAFELGEMETALSYARQLPRFQQQTEIQLEDFLPLHSFFWNSFLRRDSLAYFRRLVDAYPTRGDLLNNVAWILATAEWSPAPPEEALELAKRAVALAPVDHPVLLDTLAVAQANFGDFEIAIQTAQQALQLVPDTKEHAAFRQRLLDRIHLFQNRQPYHVEQDPRLL